MKPCIESCNCTVFHQETLTKVEKSMHKDQEYHHMIDLFKVLNDKTRLKILEAIKDDALCVCDLAYLLGVSKSAISHQMKLLKTYDLVVFEKKGKMVYYKLKDHQISQLIQLSYLKIKGQTNDKTND